MGKQFTHYTKGTLSSRAESMTVVIPAACGDTSSGFSPVYYLLFQHSLTVLCTIGQWSILSLDDDTPSLNLQGCIKAAWQAANSLLLREIKFPY
jgi:hypothetical protein